MIPVFPAAVPSRDIFARNIVFGCTPFSADRYKCPQIIKGVQTAGDTDAVNPEPLRKLLKCCFGLAEISVIKQLFCLQYLTSGDILFGVGVLSCAFKLSLGGRILLLVK